MARTPPKPRTEPPPRLASAFAAALPPPKQSKARTVRIVVALSEGERDTIAKVAKSRGEPFAVTLRTLAVTYAQIILGEKG